MNDTTASKRFQVLGHPIRLAVLSLISQHQGTLNVAGLQAKLPYDIKQPNLSHHLHHLKSAGFITGEKNAEGEIYYCLRPETLGVCMDTLTALARSGKVGSIR